MVISDLFVKSQALADVFLAFLLVFFKRDFLGSIFFSPVSLVLTQPPIMDKDGG